MIKAFPCELLTWEDMYDYGRVLSGKIREGKFRPDVVVAIARGGYVPARTLCDFLTVTDLISIKVDHWGVTAHPDSKAKLRHPLKINLSGKNVLLVDDLADTGESFKVASAHLRGLRPKKLKTASLFFLEKCPFKPDFYAAKKTWKWFVFPWNFHEDLSYLVSGLFDAKSTDKKSLGMLLEELHFKHGIDVEKTKVKDVLDDLVRKKVLMPYWTSGSLIRWMPFQKK